MRGRAASTIGAHATAVKRIVHNCALIQITLTLSARGPMPLADSVGMEMAIETLFKIAHCKAKADGGVSHTVRLNALALCHVYVGMGLVAGRYRQGSSIHNGGYEGDGHDVPDPAEMVRAIRARG